jgi:hypothetical protein
MVIDYCLGSGKQTLIELGESKLLEKKVLLSKRVLLVSLHISSELLVACEVMKLINNLFSM